MASDDSGFGDFLPDELEMLRSFFRDEAHESLEKLTTALLGSGDRHPGDEIVTELMRATHTLKGSAGTVGLVKVVEFTHRLEDSFTRLRDRHIEWSHDAQDRFIQAVDALNAFIASEEGDDATLRGKVSECLGALERLPGGKVGADPQPDPQPPAQPQPHAQPQPIPTAVPESLPLDVSGPIEGSGAIDTRREILRVAAERVDALMNSAGELVFDRTRIERRVQHLRGLARDLGQTRQRLRDHIAALDQSGELAGELRALEAELAKQTTLLATASAGLLEDSEALRRTSAALQDGLTRVRMASARSLFSRLARPLRSIARAAGKTLRLTTSGEDTEFDKAVANQIIDPLSHLLRNAVAHGIESEAERLASGKPAEGEIRIAARQAGGMVILEVSDDGRGVDPELLRRRLVESGRWTQARADLADDEEVMRSIFEQGMSTRDEADEIAGRGVGLDAVRTTIARLGGEIHMNSAPGKGTTFTMRLPVHTAVSQALLFKVHGQVYAIPNVHVVETTQVEVALGHHPAQLSVRSENIQVISLHEVLGAHIHFDATTLPVVVVEYLGKKLALTCDKIVGPRQIVLKPLGRLLAPLPLYAAGTISGSGKVQLIFDPAALIQLAHPDTHPVAASRGASKPSAVIGRALVADDSRAIREAMTRIMSRSGYIVDVAEDGQRAWDMVRELSYDLVVTDLEMPRCDGFELIERIRADAALDDLPVIIISSRDNPRNRKRAEALAVASFLAKPVTSKKVADALERLTPEKQTTRA